MNVIKSKGQYNFYKELEMLKSLKPGNYIFSYGMFGPYLVDGSEFKIPDPLYDTDAPFRQMILKSHFSEDRNTGVLLDGKKGQGKTICAKLLCNESKLPVIIIDNPIPRDLDFVGYLNNIEQEFIIFVDEFEKIFKEERRRDEGDSKNHTQESFLMIMDGALTNKWKKMFIFTTNDSVDDKFLNRPSRIKWHKQYQFIPKQMYLDIIENGLRNKDFAEDLKRHLPISEATADLLTTICNQINILEIPHSDFKEVFNHKPDLITYSVEVQIVGEDQLYALNDIKLSYKPTIEDTHVNDLRILEITRIGEGGIEFISGYQMGGITKAIPKFAEILKDNPQIKFKYRFTKKEIFSNIHAF